jgi:hypothetical protein
VGGEEGCLVEEFIYLMSILLSDMQHFAVKFAMFWSQICNLRRSSKTKMAHKLQGKLEYLTCVVQPSVVEVTSTSLFL